MSRHQELEEGFSVDPVEAADWLCRVALGLLCQLDLKRLKTVNSDDQYCPCRGYIPFANSIFKNKTPNQPLWVGSKDESLFYCRSLFSLELFFLLRKTVNRNLLACEISKKQVMVILNR